MFIDSFDLKTKLMILLPLDLVAFIVLLSTVHKLFNNFSQAFYLLLDKFIVREYIVDVVLHVCFLFSAFLDSFGHFIDANFILLLIPLKL